MSAASQTPLVEQLRAVPKDGRAVVETSGGPFPESRSIPFGRMCHEAADYIEMLSAMARRYQWLCEDHADAATRQRCREILERMCVRSESANSAAIDAAMQMPSEAERFGMDLASGCKP